MAFYSLDSTIAICDPIRGTTIVRYPGVLLGKRGSAPAWSWDSRQIAVITRSPGDISDGISVVDRDPPVVLRASPEIGAIHSLTWSPDGRHIAFEHTPTGSDHGRLAWVSLETGAVQKLRTGMEDHISGSLKPQWSRDGSMILFNSRSSSNEHNSGITWIDVRTKLVGRMTPGLAGDAYWQMMP